LTHCQQQKQAVMQAVLSGVALEDYPQPEQREARATMRVSLRQIDQQAQYHPNIKAWMQYFEKIS